MFKYKKNSFHCDQSLAQVAERLWNLHPWWWYSKHSWTLSWITCSGCPCLEHVGWTRWSPEAPGNLNCCFHDCVSWLKEPPASPVPRSQRLDSSSPHLSFLITVNAILCTPLAVSSQGLINANKRCQCALLFPSSLLLWYTLYMLLHCFKELEQRKECPSMRECCLYL